MEPHLEDKAHGPIGEPLRHVLRQDSVMNDVLLQRRQHPLHANYL